MIRAIVQCDCCEKQIDNHKSEKKGWIVVSYGNKIPSRDYCSTYCMMFDAPNVGDKIDNVVPTLAESISLVFKPFTALGGNRL